VPLTISKSHLIQKIDPEELVLRIKNHFRTQNSSLTYGDIEFDPTTGEVNYAGEQLFLGTVHKNILNRLLGGVGTPVSLEELMGFLEKPNPNALRVSINKLKKKLDIDIRNIRGQGYILEAI